MMEFSISTLFIGSHPGGANNEMGPFLQELVKPHIYTHPHRLSHIVLPLLLSLLEGTEEQGPPVIGIAW